MFEVIVYKTLGDASAENFENNNADNFKQTFSFILYIYTIELFIDILIQFLS